MSHVIEINDVSQLSQYRQVWQSLLSETRRRSFFHTLDWLQLYWKHFGQNQKLRVLVASSFDEPVGILPLCVRSQQTAVGPLRVLTYPVVELPGFGPVATIGPIGPNATATALLAMRYLRETSRDWDVIDLPTSAADNGRMQRAMQAQGFTAQKQSATAATRFDVPDNWHNFISETGRRWWDAQRRWESRLESLGKVALRRYRPRGTSHGDGDPQWELYEACQAIARRGRKASAAGPVDPVSGSVASNGSTLANGSTVVADELAAGNGSVAVGGFWQRFGRAVHQVAAERGMLDLCLLMFEQQPAAFLYGLHVGGHLHVVQAGVDPTFHTTHAQDLLVTLALRDGCQRGDLVYEFNGDVPAASLQLVGSRETNHRLVHYAPLGMRAQAVRLDRWLRARRARRRQEIATSTGTSGLVLPKLQTA